MRSSLVPKVRFKNDKGLDYPSWHETEFGNEFLRITKKNIDNNMNVLTISAQNGLVSQLNYFTKSVSSRDVSGYYFLEKGDFAYNKSYSKGYPMGAIKPLSFYDSGVVSPLYICFRSKNENSCDFFAQYFESGRLNTEIAKIAQEGARNHGLLNVSVKEFFSDIRLCIPQTDEQQKIADFLIAVDSKIRQLTEKHRLLKEYKKGIMQQLFSQQLRFKDDDNKAFPEWRVERIGKYLEPYRELVSADTEIPILTSSRTGLYPQERSVINEGDYGVVPLGYFTYRHMSDDLVFKFNVNRWWEKGAVSKEYPVFKTVDMDSYYLELQLNEGNDFKRFAIQQKQGGTRTRLYFKNLQELKLNLPSLKEQQKIAQFLQAIDNKIDGVAEQVEQIKQFKKGLLQQMFV
ncbi:restriction endonuclease subunit S [Shewanella sp. MMG014]|uniref:restriction endonuclease subunit S n=1 Tax=Shewanella sp. MMG014 TaxID=2822691 RepID=UPI001B37AB81|nr:restriction endonuclease subunit S [Shewanella sp. MMG014]MBQ4889294.1 restriction endonuclease subunit S [Shewanella sp. MMG014]